MKKSPAKSRSGANHPFFLDLVEKATGVREYTIVYRHIKRDAPEIKPAPFLELLGLAEVPLSAAAQDTIEILEDMTKNGEDLPDWTGFKWKLDAYIHLADIFDAPGFQGASPLNLFQQWYFYFESKYLLNESLLCGMSGFYAAANALLRVFLEFSILQLYYRNLIEQTQSYNQLETYFKTGIQPTWTKALKKAVPSDSFCKPIRARLDFHLKGLSRMASHPYEPGVSPRQHSGQHPGPSLEGIYFWIMTDIVLQGVLWAYYVNFPMVFHPVDTMRKFAFNPPLGLFIDDSTAIRIERSLTDEEYKEFFEYSKKNADTQSLLDWFNSMPDLTDDAIRATWDEAENGELKDLLLGHCRQVAKMRVIKEKMALGIEKIDEDSQDDPAALTRLLEFDQWKKHYKKLLKHQNV